MNETIKTILERRSVRKFTDQPIAEEALACLVEAAMHAPSGHGYKTWKFTVVTNREWIAKLAEVIRVRLGREGYDMYRPAAIIIPSNKRDSIHGKEDDACALQNIFLAAHSLGIGSVWINQLQGICDEPEIRAVLRGLHIPEDHVVYGLAALGYADPDTPVRPYRKIGEIEYIR